MPKIKLKKKTKKPPKKSDKRGLRKPVEYETFTSFMALPYSLRKKEFGFETLRDFAKKYKVSPDSLTDWKEREGFWESVRKKMKEWAKDKTPNVIAGLYRTAIREGRSAEAKLWLQYIESWEEKSQLDVKSEDIKQLTRSIKKIAERK